MLQTKLLPLVSGFVSNLQTLSFLNELISNEKISLPLRNICLRWEQERQLLRKKCIQTSSFFISRIKMLRSTLEHYEHKDQQIMHHKYIDDISESKLIDELFIPVLNQLKSIILLTQEICQFNLSLNLNQIQRLNILMEKSKQFCIDVALILDIKENTGDYITLLTKSLQTITKILTPTKIELVSQEQLQIMESNLEGLLNCVM